MNTHQAYFSPYIRAYKCWSELQQALSALRIPFDFLPDTRDIWVRDFMPVPTADNSLFGYVYAPDYLRGLEQYQSIGTKIVGKVVNRNVRSCPLVLDGGNIIPCGDKVIMTEKIFAENSQLSPGAVRDAIEQGMQAELVVLPWDRRERLGHADGIVRYAGSGRVLLNNFCDTDTSYRQKVLPLLQPHFEVMELHYPVTRPHKWSWAYLNYLRVGNRVVMPRLDSPEDDLAQRQLETLLGVSVATVNVDTLLRRGGALNCISWTL